MEVCMFGDEQVISLLHTKGLRICRLCIVSWKDKREDRLMCFKSSSEHRALDTIDGEPTEFEWNSSQDSPHCSSATRSKSSCRI